MPAAFHNRSAAAATCPAHSSAKASKPKVSKRSKATNNGKSAAAKPAKPGRRTRKVDASKPPPQRPNRSSTAARNYANQDGD
eukprot:5290176-Pleurochrysis_carterae.AAC.1